MPLFIHKIIDGLSMKGRMKLIAPSYIENSDEVILDMRRKGPTMLRATTFAKNLIKSEKFDFGDLMLQKRVDGMSFEVPNITKEELDAVNNGDFPLPAPFCWYEFKMGEFKSGILVSRLKDVFDNDKLPAEHLPLIAVHRFDYPSNDEVTFGDYWSLTTAVDGDGYEFMAKGWSASAYMPSLKAYKDFMSHTIAPITWLDYTIANVKLAAYLTLMINSKTTDIETKTADEKINKKRRILGRTPFFSHRVVRIVPERFIKRSEAEAELNHRSPRLHWRRSHIRTYQRGTDKEYKIIIPRFLVGSAELGEVSHEYKVVSEAWLGDKR